MPTTLYTTHKRSWLMGLFSDCPCGDESPRCLSREIRKLSVDDRLYIAEGVTDQVVERFLEQHRLCLAARKDLRPA